MLHSNTIIFRIMSLTADGLAIPQHQFIKREIVEQECAVKQEIHDYVKEETSSRGHYEHEDMLIKSEPIYYEPCTEYLHSPVTE